MRRFIIAGIVVLAGCRELGLVESPPHEQYQRRLARAGLLEAPLGTDWTTAARHALAKPVIITTPYRETGDFAAERPRAAGYRVSLRRGQRLVVNLSRRSGEAQLFVDLFQIPADSSDSPERIASADSGGTGLDVEIDEDATYIVRIQPELLRPARYTLTILGGPTFAMPVSGALDQDIKSIFGVERDAGRRQHEGIDIFAPRGTPVLAAAPGRIVEVGENNLGGNVVWQWDPARNQNLYYAHLDIQLARDGQEVQKGDTIGLVGNSGNARTTPPHLHFGIYRKGSGAIDPLPFVYVGDRRAERIVGDTGDLGAWVEVARREVGLTGLVPAGAPAPRLPAGTVMRVIGASGSDYRVELADGNLGFVPVTAVRVSPDSATAGAE